MKKFLSGLAMALGWCSAMADITAFTAPVGGGGSFTPLSAMGGRSPTLGQPFNDSWTLTLNAPNPSFLFTIRNSFNTGNGAGALSISGVTLTGPGIGTVSLPDRYVVANPFTTDHLFEGTFASLGAGSYVINLFGSSPSFIGGSYAIGVSVVPEPATAWLMGLGLGGLVVVARARARSIRPAAGWAA